MEVKGFRLLKWHCILLHPWDGSGDAHTPRSRVRGTGEQPSGGRGGVWGCSRWLPPPPPYKSARAGESSDFTASITISTWESLFECCLLSCGFVSCRLSSNFCRKAAPPFRSHTGRERIERGEGCLDRTPVVESRTEWKTRLCSKSVAFQISTPRFHYVKWNYAPLWYIILFILLSSFFSSSFF